MKKIVSKCLGKVKAIYSSVRVNTLKWLFFFAPVQKNKILLNNFNGKGFGCNPKYIAQEILGREKNYDLVWVVSDVEEPLPAGIRKVPFWSRRWFYEVATAKVIVTNVKNGLHLVKKKSQYVIQTWHGSYGAKLLEQDAVATLSKQYLKESKKNSAQTDLFISNSRVLSECYRKSFWCKCEIMECGFPRNDVLFGQSEETLLAVKARLGVPAGAKLALYAPTFRDDGSTDGYDLDCAGVLEALSATGDWYLLIRLHPNVGSAANLFAFNDRVIDATPYPDMQELLLVSDILITDYSSTVFDFAALEKPSFIYASDVEEYQKIRGLNEDFFRMPYPVCRTNEELFAQLRDVTAENARELAMRFNRFFGGVDKGGASKQVVDRIDAIIGTNH